MFGVTPPNYGDKFIFTNHQSVAIFL